MQGTSGPSCLDFGPFRIDVANRELLMEGEAVGLTPKAFDTLLALVERRGRVVSREELVEAVWPGTFVTDGTLTQNIYTLRKILAADKTTRYLETVPRRGYRFVAEVSVETATRSTASTPAVVDEADAGGVRSLAVLPLRILGREDDAFLGLGLGELEQALALLQQGCEERSRFIAFLSVWPIFDPLRSQPGFEDLLRRAGFGDSMSSRELSATYESSH